MNTFIAHAHRMTRKFVGAMVAAGTTIAVALSILLIVSGIAVTALVSFPPQLTGVLYCLYLAVWLVAAFLIGVLIERLTMTNCSKIRIVGEKVSILTETFDSIESPTAAVQQKHNKDLKRIQGSLAYTVPLVGLGVCLSMFSESLIIQYLFVSWHPIVLPVGSALLTINMQFLASLFLSGLVSYTLVSSELGKKTDADVIHESIAADTFLQVAAVATIHDTVNRKILSQSCEHAATAINSDVMRDAIQTNVLAAVDRHMGGNGTVVVRVDNERKAKQLELEQETVRTSHQLRLLKGGKDSSSSTVATVSLLDVGPANGTAAAVSGPAKGRKARRDYTENKRSLAGTLTTMGPDYFTSDRVKETATRMGLSERTVYRILEDIQKTTA